jgi:hypothetical protein
MVRYSKQVSKNETHALSLDVEEDGVDIIVKAGDFRIGGVDYTLGEDQVFSVANKPEKFDAMAFLVEQISDGSILVVVDEKDYDTDSGWDEPYDWNESPYRLIEHIWHANFPPNTTALDDIIVYATRISEQEEEGE